ncbi:eukaryotic rRNA processing protein EBP2 [Opisthorchis viverrini]|uniref:Eukaryotic rRNA processing protein EBP2 n=1 Tax=Opisthorchis viverrini TaxID=6198 RepID=A0A1S8WHE6_OPIVI|nr:eukaryotic rRNA processing protein EBP2 [Opisthorchis viverrini]
MSDSESLEDLQELIACPGLYREITVPRQHVNNKAALTNTLEHLCNKLPWIERLDVVTKPAPAAKELDVPDTADQIDPDDDFKRENYFYRLGQAAVLVAIPKLHQLGVPTKRPADYFAEMVKTDEQMGKIKQHLVETQQRLTLRERARQMRERRKFGKQTQQAVLQARKAEKRQLTDAIKASRKKFGKDHDGTLDQILGEYRDTPDKQKPGFNRAKDVANRRKINYQRDYKNKKYGHGGQKKRSKRNTAESFSGGARKDFNPAKHQAKPKKLSALRKNRGKSGKPKGKKRIGGAKR